MPTRERHILDQQCGRKLRIELIRKTNELEKWNVCSYLPHTNQKFSPHPSPKIAAITSSVTTLAHYESVWKHTLLKPQDAALRTWDGTTELATT